MPGEILKKKREELGYNLKEIAHTLRIRFDYLKAIEEGTFEKLPVEVYTKGYIREYAKFLKTDPEAVIKAYIEKISPPAIEKQPVPDNPPTSPFNKGGQRGIFKEEKPARRYSATAITLSAAAVAALLIALSLLFFAPEEPKTPLPEKTKVETAINPQKEKTAKEHTLEILASDKTWILVTIDNSETKELLLNKGESAKLSAKDGFSLKIGNAGGIKLIFDGKDMGAPGENGRVITLKLPSDKNLAR
ncbi:MAG: hypothetical protein COZ31_11195 [Nitrospirae bacterium CG_4_10_14_3_um_filter_44_29]|nr:MAG: hypothetical protein AUJ60_06495 [Nitrospirae bacterium CG1_02_44_142]PIP69633.1 MAG: hypothetical protein COW90_09600 [Nitrospirae bacterium CG22_combo_CG10-13_8_21_14_all_44_11]PIX87288.1 MAG: hypothetical protein COZ31_11195 [Nitrospirae bacterium CG_4_10_14_3_um_filter_44_29]